MKQTFWIKSFRRKNGDKNVVEKALKKRLVNGAFQL
jgi:hypothetical protein